MRPLHLLSLIGLLASTALHANNIQVANTTLVDNTGSTVKVQFDINWENSWRGGGVINWDAAWVFVKCKLANGAWVHARLSSSGHTQPTGSQVDLGLLTPGITYDVNTNPVIGVFIRRATDGSGTFSASGVQLLWDYAAQGIVAFNDISEVEVFGIEMVYVNEGPFSLGRTGGNEPNQFYDGGNNSAFQVTSEAPLTVSSTTLWAEGLIVSGVLQSGFPKGFRASYVMKYEISQQQYVDFLNAINRSQQNASINGTSTQYVLSSHNSVIYRQSIRTFSNVASPEPLYFETSRPYVACSHIGNNFLRRYLDWSGLRPMTELEYEKACRGPLPPIPNEYAWGSASLSSGATTYTLTSSNNDDESIATGYSTGNANFTVSGGSVFTMGPFRVGIFAAHPSNVSRATAGASYYGVMELSGNVAEKAVSLSTSQGQAYMGQHGDGELGSSYLLGIDIIPRGGGCFNLPEVGQVSDRSGSASVEGGRGVRTAP